jgi:hypothetical protein
MDMNQAAVFLAGSILTMLGFVVVVAGVIVVNNLLHKYWKPVTWLKYQFHPVYYDAANGQPLVKEEPVLEKEKK